MPPLTVASLQIMTTSHPDTLPIPVSMPAEGASFSYISWAANCENSKNGDPGSNNVLIRS